MREVLRLLIVGLLGTMDLCAADYHVTPVGTPSGDGSDRKPWALQTALTNRLVIQPGDTVWLHGGTYIPTATNSQSANMPGWLASLNGANNKLITFRSYSNEWAKIDRQWRFGSSTFLRFRDLEFYDSFKGSNPTNVSYPNGPWLHFDDRLAFSSGDEWINCVIHDVNNCWSGGTAGDSVRGCIIWNVGLNALEHVAYVAANKMSGNISAWHVSNFINLNTRNVTASSNIVFGSGQPIGGSQGGDILAGNFNQSYLYNVFFNRYASDKNIASIIVGGVTTNSVIIHSNIIIAPSPVQFNLGPIGSVSLHGNTVHMSSPFTSWAVIYRRNNYGTWTMNNNHFTAEANNIVRFEDLNVMKTFNQWKADNAGFDTSSTSTNSALPPDSVTVIPNEDEPKRAHIAVYNGTLADNVTVNLSNILSEGDTYQLYSAQNYGEGAIRNGTFSGTTINVPMTNLTTAPVLYGTNWGLIRPPPTSPEFAAFVVISYAPIKPAAPTNLRVISSQ